jgi:hypothetical protein
MNKNSMRDATLQDLDGFFCSIYLRFNVIKIYFMKFLDTKELRA